MVGKKRLGRGLDALLPRDKSPKDNAQKEPATPENSANNRSHLDEIPVEWIKPGKYQPRTHFAEESIEELAESIKAQGVMQPIVLRPLDTNQYEIIAGERRWRAAQRAGMEKIPAVIREVDDESALAMSLIENIQREDLNPLEEAIALQRLIDDFQFTHQEVAEAVGKSRSAVTNTLRLTHLAEPVAEMLTRGDLEMGHARALLTLEQDEQAHVARTIVAKGLNVRQTEALVRSIGKPASTSKKSGGPDADTRRLEDNLGQQIGQPVQIKHSKKGKGKLIISYSSLDELSGILGRMGYEE
ncbi:MAG: ParB/RepB/Spo0J family partition protein [Pseudomonadales bacterium]|nr:ParB/RepB/Spo0J family partition protein [Pseudomonadales bacterium]